MIPMQLTNALKEWAVTVEALLAGQTVMLIRKGGIREAQGKFSLKTRRILLLPTYEHQRQESLKPQFSIPPQKPLEDQLELPGWAEITHVITLNDKNALMRLNPWHIWNSDFIEQRWNWQPQKTLFIMLLRSHRLSSPVQILNHASYSGCRSWIQVINAISTEDSSPSLDLVTYNNQVTSILDAIGDAGEIQLS